MFTKYVHGTGAWPVHCTAAKNTLFLHKDSAAKGIFLFLPAAGAGQGRYFLRKD